MALVGQPQTRGGERWNDITAEAALLMEKARVDAGIVETTSRRGKFAVVTAGISYGGGQQVSN